MERQLTHTDEPWDVTEPSLATPRVRRRSRAPVPSAGLSHPGMVRARNEDGFLLDDELRLYMVADGMGGHLHGDVASRIAVEHVGEALRTSGARRASDGRLVGLLAHAFRHVNRELIRRAEAARLPGRIGTTALAVAVGDGLLYGAHVGDSRLYLLHRDEVRRVTRDHTQLQLLIDLGIAEQEARRRVPPNILTRGLGICVQVEVDPIREPLADWAGLLLCTDGLSDLVSDTEIAAESARGLEAPEVLCAALLKRALRRGAPDNVTVVIVNLRAAQGRRRIAGGTASAPRDPDHE